MAAEAFTDRRTVGVDTHTGRRRPHIHYLGLLKPEEHPEKLPSTLLPVFVAQQDVEITAKRQKPTVGVTSQTSHTFPGEWQSLCVATRHH